MCSCGKCAHWKSVHPHWQWRSKCVSADRTQTLPRHVCTPGVWRCHKLCERSGELGGTCRGIDTHCVFSSTEWILLGVCAVAVWASSERKHTAPTVRFSARKDCNACDFPDSCTSALLFVDSGVFDRCWKTMCLSSDQHHTVKMPNKSFWNYCIMAAHIQTLLIAIAGYPEWLLIQTPCSYFQIHTYCLRLTWRLLWLLI